MNRTNILALADRIENSPDFDMNFWGYADEDCGTAMCIAGHAFVMLKGRPARDEENIPAIVWLEFFDMPGMWPKELFTPPLWLRVIKKPHAAMFLRLLAKGPECDAHDKYELTKLWRKVISELEGATADAA